MVLAGCLLGRVVKEMERANMAVAKPEVRGENPNWIFPARMNKQILQNPRFYCEEWESFSIEASSKTQSPEHGY